MRILVVNYEFPPLGGGGAPVCYCLSRELVRLGHHVDVVTMGFNGLDPFEVVEGIHVYRVPCIRHKAEICHTYEMISFAVGALPVARRLVRENRYTVNHTHFIFPSAAVSYLLKKMTGLPYVVTTHGSDVPGYNPDRFKLEHDLLRPFWKALVKEASSITSPSQSLKDLILKSSSRTTVQVIPNAIDISAFEPKPKKKRILMVSRLFRRKGFQYVLEALEGLNTDFEVVIVGEGPYMRNLKDLARDKGLDVRFPGWMDNHTPEFKELLETSAIFALPSEMENFSIALIEAMAAGAAIITSLTGGCPEVVGDTAFKVVPDDVPAIRVKLRELLDDEALRAEMGAKARARVEQNFTWEVVARQFEALFSKYETD
ncbi:MAG: glycosyltransferase family 4 protein [Planctomycetota bacterium]